MSETIIRQGKVADLAVITAIYNHYVTTTHVTFDLSPFDPEQRRAWIEQFEDHGRLRLFVAQIGDGVVGYACSTPLKPRPAYDVSVETSVYLDPSVGGRGWGSRLMQALLDALTNAGVHGAYAGIALPNEASEVLHRKLGYRHVGVLKEVGRKFDRYWDVAWYEKRLGVR